MKKEQIIASFDPNDAGSGDQIFGLPFSAAQSEIHVFPAPWEVTVSYGSGTCGGPKAIKEASLQVDLFDENYPDTWQRGIWMHDVDEDWANQNSLWRLQAKSYLKAYNAHKVISEEEQMLEAVNTACTSFHQWVEMEIGSILNEKKRVILLGGDHSTSLGAVRAHKEKYGSFGILQIDAHADLRVAYEGFKYSHASIMHNVMEEELATSLTIVGLRDFCHQESERISEDPAIHAFTDRAMNNALFQGQSWTLVCRNIVNTLPENVYLSVDIDGFDPSLCPSTGTPVPGGLSMNQFSFLLDAILATGRKIIGADLVEVAPGANDWDANVGARVLYAISHRLAPL
jgi:agmatinase